MSIVNGYATLLEVRQAMDIANTYTAITISFAVTTNILTDTGYGLRRFQDADIITISGSTLNDGTYTIVAGTGNTAGTFTTTQNLATEVAGDTVTITVIQDQKDDATIERAVNSASRWIDDITGTRFYTTAADETRYYTATDPYELLLRDDLLSLTTLKTDDDGDGTFENTWTVSTDFILGPYNATLDSEPYTWIERTVEGNYSFPSVRRGVQAVGKFAFSSTAPYEIKEACIMLSQRLLKRKDAPLGVMGTQAMGFIRLEDAIDPDVKNLLSRWLTRKAYG